MLNSEWSGQVAEFEMSNIRNETGEQLVQLEVRRLNDGLGFGTGTITGSPEGATADTLAAVDAAIEHDPKILMPVDYDESGNVLDDDGCGDGRGVRTIFTASGYFKRSLNRAKVFGGSLTMTVAARIGMANNPNAPLTDVFESSLGELDEKGIDFGAHTDTHEDGVKCGCGAIDRSPEVVENAVKFESEIRATIAALVPDTNGLDKILENYTAYADAHTGQSFSGNAVMKAIVDSGKVVKQLDGDHKEARIILNTVEGYTVNQELIRQVSDETAQVFAVDVWRLQNLAGRLYPNDAVKQQQAFLSELVYTLGVAGTLTNGTLPTYLIQKSPVSAGVEA
jgi:hypothetical protein